MTEESQKKCYESLVHHQKPIESNLANFLSSECSVTYHLAEHLNAEIALQTITDVSIAIKWLKSTFFYQRCQKNPSYYKMIESSTSEKLDQKLKRIYYMLRV